MILTRLVYFNQIWDSGYPYVESFETDPKNQIRTKFGQFWAQFWKKKSNGIYFASENDIFKILHILKHINEIWREAHLAN